MEQNTLIVLTGSDVFYLGIQLGGGVVFGVILAITIFKGAGWVVDKVWPK